ncbi:diguanylate phosphodiesterase [Gracilibacillus dipsosauri]|uniref:Diguanylate phosphodiesterase n=2 Tax=Gracilibacillus dipsosauri TaxID=178340 RepID=A0A317KXV2_9BACI|nr:diguanylate phosphodiesterase [Gracilibacillus dipsosauri]
MYSEVFKMDPLDIMLDMERVKPYYQPVFSADSHEVVGYQVLGYLETERKRESIRAFFQDQNVPDEFKVDMDRHIHRRALDIYLKHNVDASIFLIVHQSYLTKTEEEKDFVQELISYQEKGLDLSKVILEIVEQESVEEMDNLSNSLKYLKTFGVKIAINDAGRGSSNMDRISTLEPDIIKINLASLLDQSLSVNYQHTIYSLSILARRVGAELLFDGIESNYHFHYAWRNNGRYYQGPFLSTPSEAFIRRDLLKTRFRKDIQQFIYIERSKINAKYQLTETLNEKLQQNIKMLSLEKNLEEEIDRFITNWDEMFFRIYVTDADGFQKTANYIYTKDAWRQDLTVKGKNWSWRPYFIENVIRMNHDQTGILSDIYNDIETGERIRTFSYPIDENLYVFMDISPMYLDEHEDLLW